MADQIAEYEGKLPGKILEEVRANLPKNASDTKTKKIMEAVYEEYMMARVHPGESVGLVSAESIGEPGTQMSLDYEEKVIVRNNNKIKVVKIGEFIDRVMKFGRGLKKSNETEVCDINDAELYVPALSQDEKVVWKKVSALSRHDSPEQLIEIKTRSGRKITATPYHSFVVRNNNRIVPVAASQLKKGIRIPSVRKLETNTGNEFIKLEDYLPKTNYIYESEVRKALNKSENYVLPFHSYEQLNNYAQGNVKFQLKQDCVYMHQNHSMAYIPEVLEMDFSFGFFIGAYLAEGTHTENYISISNVSEEYLRQIKDFAEKYNVNYKVKYEMGQFGRSTSLLIYSTLLSDLIVKSCGKGAHNKFVPDFAYSANGKFVKGVLQAYFDGDGNISVDRKAIRVSSCSKDLIDGIAFLLSKFGIFSSKSRAKGNQATLNISYRYAKRFSNMIGSVIPYKAENVRKLAQLNGKKTSYDIIEMIPGYGNIFSAIGKSLGVPSRLTNKFTEKQKIGRNTLKKYIGLFEKKSQQKKVSVDKNLEILKNMLNSDVVWDEIESMQHVKPSGPFVYDFSVEDLETFTTFDGIITHNTLNTFHFAGVAELNVTMGLPRIIEILDGRKELENSMMEIYLKKPFASGKKIEELRHLAMQIKETKLKDISNEFTINIADFTIEAKLDKAKMKELELTNNKAIDAITKQVKGFNVKDNGDSLIFKSRSKEDSFNDAYKAKEKIKDITIKGIKGIKQVLPVRREDEFIIITAGSNLGDVLQLGEVDAYRTTTNNIFEIEQVLGIEAARQAIIDEIFKVIESQGLNVDVRHIMLVADTMCVSGTLKGITRYGVVSEKSSVLARASFETPIKHIINAALVGEVDNLNSVVENVMINQAVPIGTGLPTLSVKVPKAKEK